MNATRTMIEPALLRRRIAGPGLGLAGLALLVLCLHGLLPHDHGFEEDRECGACLIAGLPRLPAPILVADAVADRDLVRERLSPEDTTLPPRPALGAPFSRGPPPA